MPSNLPDGIRQAIAEESQGRGGSSEVGLPATLRYDSEKVKELIDEIKLDKDSDKVIHGTKNLIRAAEGPEEQGLKARVRPGQLLFGTASLARVMGHPPYGRLLNAATKRLLKFSTGEAREFPYMHVGIYAGKVNGEHYVIHNGGSNLKSLGMISAATIEEAFDSEGSFFVLSPPLDSKDNSTRYLVLQRALACLGTFYDYDIRAVSCEVFALTMMKLKPTFEECEPFQIQALKPPKNFCAKMVGYKKDGKDEDRFNDFFTVLDSKIRKYNENAEKVILTLKYYVEQKIGDTQKGYVIEGSSTAEGLNNSCSDPWWRGMKRDYKEFAKAVKESNFPECKKLIDKGLNISGKLYNEELTAKQYAKKNEKKELEKFLIDARNPESGLDWPGCGTQEVDQ